jgi:hypothetical protein
MYVWPSVALAITKRTPEAATCVQSIVCCQWETSIPGSEPGG